MNHYHWRFVAWNGEPNARELQFAVTITVIGYLDELSALEAVKDILKRENYALQAVWECNTCAYQEKNTEALNRLTNKL